MISKGPKVVLAEQSLVVPVILFDYFSNNISITNSTCNTNVTQITVNLWNRSPVGLLDETGDEGAKSFEDNMDLALPIACSVLGTLWIVTLLCFVSRLA